MTGEPAAWFGGVRVALLESRLAEATAALVRRLGGEPLSAPALAEHDLDADAEVNAFIDRLAARPGGLAVFLTGVAVTRLFAAAGRAGRGQALLDGLARAVTVVRGPKPAGALARHGLSAAVAVSPPFTTEDVVTALEAIPVAGRDATVVHYGERNEPIVDSLRARGADVRDLMLYAWRLPADLAPLSAAIDGMIDGQVAALACTSRVQVRHLFEVAGGRRDALLAALNTSVLVGAVGPTCAAACAAAGIRDVIAPAQPRLAPLLYALAGARSGDRGVRRPPYHKEVW